MIKTLILTHSIWYLITWQEVKSESKLIPVLAHFWISFKASLYYSIYFSAVYSWFFFLFLIILCIVFWKYHVILENTKKSRKNTFWIFFKWFLWAQSNEKYGHKTTKSMDTKQQEVWTQNNEKYGHKTTRNIDTKEILSQLNVHSSQFNHGKARKRCEMVSKITTKTLEQRQRRCFGVFIFNFEHILQLFQSLYWWLQSSKCLLGRPNKLLNCYQVVFQAILFS